MAILIILTFITVAAIIIGSYVLLVARPEEQAHKTVKRRLAPRARIAVLRTGLVKEKERLSHVAAVETLLARVGDKLHPLQKLIDQAGVNVSISVVLLSCGCLALTAFVVMEIALHTWWLALVAAGLAAVMPILVLRKLRQRRLLKFEEQFPEAIDLIARALRAGHAFTTGLSMVADEAPQPVAGEFRVLFDQQNFGMPLPEALRQFAHRIPVLDAQFFATAVLTQREAGGNLSEVLDNLGSVIRERFRVKRQVRVLSAHGRMTGWILGLLPPALAAAFMVISPRHMQTLIGDPLGHLMIGGALALQLIGTYIISKIVKIEY